MRPSRPPGRHVPRHARPPLILRGSALTGLFCGILLVASASIGAFAGPAGPPPTPVPPSGSPSPYPQELHTPRPSTQVPRIHAAAAILVNARTGQILYAKRPGARRAIASLTKVMTATIAVRARALSHTVTVTGEAARQTGSTLGLEPGERISVRSLLFALFLQSSNDAATALADDISGTTGGFVARMNARARQLHMAATRFASPNGLDDRGYSSAADLATLARTAIADDDLVRIMRTKFAVIANRDGPARRIQNRNAMLWLYPGAFGVKTGYTSEAGQCLVTAAARDGRTLVAVVLGDVGDRVFDDSAELLNYGFTAFDRSEVLRPGDPVGSVTVGGVAVDAVAGARLIALVPAGRSDDVSIDVAARAGLTLPLTAGDPIGRAVVRVPGMVLGSVPAVAASGAAGPNQPVPTAAPPPAPPSDPPGPLDLVATLLRATFGPVL